MEEIRGASEMNPNDSIFQEESGGEDELLKQIDAFRDKARQLQSFINAKERKVKELEAMVRAKEAKNTELQQVLIKRQEEADGLVKDVETQVDRMLTDVKASMDRLEESISTQVANNEISAAEQTKSVRDALASMSQGLEEMGNRMDANKTKMEEVGSRLEASNTKLEEVGNELSEKVHSENVKCYRNIQDLFKEFDYQEEATQDSDKKYSSLKGQLGFLTCFTIFNFLLSIVVVLCMLGVF